MARLLHLAMLLSCLFLSLCFTPVSRAREPAGGTMRVMVLAFDNRSGDSTLDTLGGGIADSVVHALLNVRGLIVLERQRVEEVLKEQLLAQTGLVDADTSVRVGKLINANRSVGGSFQVNGPAIRIIAQLVNVESGRTVGSVQVQGPYLSLFDLQDELTTKLVAALQVGFPREEQLRVTEIIHSTASLEAFRLYTTGLDALRRVDLDRAVRQFEEAIGIDASYALAWSGLARTLALLGYQRKAARDPGADKLLARAAESARQAVTLRPSLGEAHLALASVALATGDFNLGAREAEKGLQLLPNSAEGYYFLGVARKQVLGGETGVQEKIALFRRALELDPTYVPARNDLGATFGQQGNYGAAVAQYEVAVRLNPRNAMFRDNLGYNLFKLKRYGEALQQFEQAVALESGNEQYRKHLDVAKRAVARRY